MTLGFFHDQTYYKNKYNLIIKFMRKIILLLTVVAFGTFTSCKKDSPAIPPALPPAETMVMDFKSFDASQKSEILKAALLVDSVNMDNFKYTEGTIGFWSIILFLNMAVPVASWHAALAHNDWKELEKNAWQWTFTYNALFANYNARLVAHQEGSSVRWEMLITKDGILGFTDFKWYEGLMAVDGSKGSWTLFESPANPVKYLQIDWAKTGTQVGSIKYTLIKEKDDSGASNLFYNNYIEYGATTSTPYDRFYTISIYNVFSGITDNVNIEWNNVTHEGHAKSPYFKDQNWHAWDSTGVNIK